MCGKLPATQLSRFADYALRVSVPDSNDEIAELYRGFNTMLEQVQRYERDLTNIREHLEQLVEDRPRTLDALVREQRLILEALPLGVVHLVDRSIVRVNPCAVELFGWEEQVMLCMSTEHLYPGREAYERLGRLGYMRMAGGGAFLHARGRRHHRKRRALCVRAVRSQYRRSNGGRRPAHGLHVLWHGWLRPATVQRYRRGLLVDQHLPEEPPALDCFAPDDGRLESGGGVAPSYVRHAFDGEKYVEQERLPMEPAPVGTQLFSGPYSYDSGFVLEPRSE